VVLDEADQILGSTEVGPRIMANLLKRVPTTATLAFISATFTPYITKFIQTSVSGRN